MGHNLNPGRLLPFGKFKGKAIDEVPDSYLTWLLEQDWFEEKFEDLFDDVQAEINWRKEVNYHVNG